MKEVSFGWGGFNYAMASNLGMVLRGIYSKQCLKDFKDMDGINLFGLISIASLIYCIPAALYMESHHWAAALRTAADSPGPFSVTNLLIVGGVFYHLYNQLSYMVLNQGVSPVTFSVGNTMKRVAVVVASVMFFRNPVSPLNWLGSATAIFGTYLYSMSVLKKDTK
jgi:solute carrier family 35, member E1